MFQELPEKGLIEGGGEIHKNGLNPPSQVVRVAWLTDQGKTKRLVPNLIFAFLFQLQVLI